MVIRYLFCAIGGAGIAYFIASGKFERDLETAIVEESDKARAYWEGMYREKLDALAKNQMGKYGGVVLGQESKEETPKDELEEAEPLKEAPDEKIVETVISMPPSASVRKPSKEAAPKVNYNAISTPSKVKEEPKEDELKIELITQQEFIDSTTDFKQMSFTYYPDDDVLANEMMNPIIGDARETAIGKEAIPKLKEGLDTVYVRNSSGGWEFEIAKAAGKFSDENETTG